MPRKSPAITIEEISGNHYPDLLHAQRAALPFMATHLGCVIGDLLASGILAQVNGKIVPNTNSKP